MIYFTSDLHFDHMNILSYCARPFATVQEMNETIIENYNRRVKAKDVCYILGDTMIRDTDNAKECLRRLNGRKYLVNGNHDFFKDDGTVFEWIKDYYKLRWNHKKFILCHYPFLSWDGMNNGSYCLHGHQHNKPEYNNGMRAAGLKRYDVGVDANQFAPVSIEDIIAFFEDQNEKA